MAARITVESRPQIGSTFCLALPMKVGTAHAAPASPVSAPSAQVSTGLSSLSAKRVQVLTRRQSLEESSRGTRRRLE